MSAHPADRTANCGPDTASARRVRSPLPADDTPAAAPARFLNPGNMPTGKAPAADHHAPILPKSTGGVKRVFVQPRRGGVAAPVKKRREASEAAQTGWSLWYMLTLKRYPGLTTPSAPS